VAGICGFIIILYISALKSPSCATLSVKANVSTLSRNFHNLFYFYFYFISTHLIEINKSLYKTCSFYTENSSGWYIIIEQFLIN
jgi:hypothetical protein